MPLQHVDDDVLKAMRRGHGERQSADLVERLRARVPGVTLRTTFIVGHPGETDEAFERLCDFVREAELDHVGVFNYSHEEGTPPPSCRSASPQKEIDAPPARAPAHPARHLEEEAARPARPELEVLVEGPSDESEYLLMGRHEGQAPEIDGQVYLSLSPTPRPRPPPAPSSPRA